MIEVRVQVGVDRELRQYEAVPRVGDFLGGGTLARCPLRVFAVFWGVQRTEPVIRAHPVDTVPSEPGLAARWLELELGS